MPHPFLDRVKWDRIHCRIDLTAIIHECRVLVADVLLVALPVSVAHG